MESEISLLGVNELRKNKLGALFTLLGLVMSTSLTAGWHDRKCEGWAWYEDKQEVREQKPKKEERLSKLDKATKEVEEAQKRIKGLLAIALLDPTDENIENYLIEQKKWLEKSQLMSKKWEKVVLENPELNHILQFPISQYGSKVRIQEKQNQTKGLITYLKEDHSLIFFYEGESSESTAFAKVAKRFSVKHDYELVAVSTDGTILEDFPNSLVNNKLPKGVQAFPALFIFDQNNKEMIPISYGLNTVDGIERNILLQFTVVKE